MVRSAESHSASVVLRLNHYSDLVTRHLMKEDGGCIVAYHWAYSIKAFIFTENAFGKQILRFKPMSFETTAI